MALLAATCGEIKAVTIDECRQMARDNYPEVKRLRLINATKEMTMKNISTQWLPQVMVAGQASWQNNAGNILDLFDAEIGEQLTQALPKLQPIKKFQYQAGVDVNQTIYDGGAVKLQRKVAEADADIQSKEIDVQLYTLDGRVEEVFFSILLLESRTAQTEEKISMLSENRQKLLKLFKNGTVAETESDIIEAEELVSRQQLKVLASKIRMYRQMLSLLTGTDMMGEKLIRPEMPTVYEAAADTRPEYALLDAQFNRLVLGLRKLDVDLMPKVGLFGQAYYGYPDMNVFRSMTDDGMSFNFKVGVKVAWNISELYNRNRSQKIIASKINELEVKRNMLAYNNNLANVTLVPEIERLQSSLEDDQRIIELRRKIRKSAETKLNNGIADATELRQKIVDETNAVQDYELHSLELLKTAYQMKHNGK